MKIQQNQVGIKLTKSRMNLAGVIEASEVFAPRKLQNSPQRVQIRHLVVDDQDPGIFKVRESQIRILSSEAWGRPVSQASAFHNNG